MNKEQFLEQIKSMTPAQKEPLMKTLRADGDYQTWSSYYVYDCAVEQLKSFNAHKARNEKLKKMLGDDDYRALVTDVLIIGA